MSDPYIDVKANTRMLVNRWINDINTIGYLIEDAVRVWDPSDPEQTTTIALTARHRLIFQRINDALSGATIERREFAVGDVHFIGEILTNTGDPLDLELGAKVLDFIPAATEAGYNIYRELIPICLPLAEWAIVDEKASDTGLGSHSS